MTHVDTGITGAKRQSWRHDNPRDLLKVIIDNNTQASKEELLELFTQKVFEKGNRALLETIIEYWFANNLHSLFISDSKLKRQFMAPQIKKVKDQIRQRIKVAAGVILMDMVMPNKKRLRDCSGAECATVGGWLSIVAARMPPAALVGQAFDEKTLRAILTEVVEQDHGHKAEEDQ